MSRQISELDRDAIERAIAITRTTDLDVDYHLKRDGWLRGGLFCVYAAQWDDLKPRFHQKVPMDVDPADIELIISRGDNGARDYAAARLLRHMLRAGLSRFEPRPTKALAEAKERAAAAPPVAPAPESTV
jgi:hypothetical protein